MALANIPSLATLIVVLIGILINNHRFNDLSANVNNRLNDMSARFGDRFGDLSHRIDDTRDVLRAEMEVLRVEMAKNQSELLMKFAELDQRVSRLGNEHR
jgi:hypothetical protein